MEPTTNEGMKGILNPGIRESSSSSSGNLDVIEGILQWSMAYELGMAMRIYLEMRSDADIGLYPTYVGYSAILLDNAEVDADIPIRMAIPNIN